MFEYLRDNAVRYGLLSRALHWGMAYLLIWQVATLVGWRLLGDGEVMRTVSRLGPAHVTVGIFSFLLVLLRGAWALKNRDRRPPAGRGPFGRAARLVHRSMYVLMLVVPLLALVRAHGSGKGLDLWCVHVLPATGRQVSALMRPADLLHGPLAWTLAALIAGHVAMTLYHALVRRDGILRRMAGPIRRPDRGG